MVFKGFKWAKGYVKCSLKGKYHELFINMSIKNELRIWDFNVKENNEAEFSIGLDDFFKLKPILKKTFSKIHIKEKVGLPFLLKSLQKRKGLMISFSLFVLLVYLFSSIIWIIDINGNKRITDEKVEQVINGIGIHQGMFKFQLPDSKEIQEKILQELQQTAWVGVKLKGSHLYIEIVEKVQPEEKVLESPRNIISTKNAIIHRIIAEKGLPQVKVNDHVKKGDILISGIIGDEDNNKVVVAKGEVKGVVWYTSSATVPLKRSWRQFTGEKLERKYIYIGERMIRFKGKKEILFKKYEKRYNYKKLTWKNYKLPIGIINEEILEYEKYEQVLTEEKAILTAKKLAKDHMIDKISETSSLISEKVLHASNENGKVTIKILFEVIEDITTTQPIIQGE